MEKVYDMVIVGGGPGGYTAALYAARAGFSTIVIERLSAGGQLALTHNIENYPGFENGINGYELAEKMIDEDTALATIYYGADTDEESANALADRISEKYGDIDVSVVSGGQPVYYYMIAVE